MRNFFQKIGDGLRRFMQGRYGTDQLNQVLLIGGAAMMLLGLLGRRVPVLALLSLLAYVPLIWSIVRAYSRNIEKRRQENIAWLRFLSRLKDREHRYFRCPNCGQRVRVPRGRGRINIRCPKCACQFIKKT